MRGWPPYFRKILLTRPNDWTPVGLVLLVLTGLSKIYGCFISRRARWKRRLPPERFGVPILSVGNLTVGGTGKTPMTACLAGRIVEKIPQVGIVLRGYGRRMALRSPVLVGEDFPPEKELDVTGDEALVLAGLCPSARIMVCADRTAAIDRLVRDYGVRIVLLDDGFQQLRLPKIIDIVCMDSRKPFGNGYLLPRGLLREPASALKRATHIIFPKGPPSTGIQNIINQASGVRLHADWYCSYRISGVYPLQDPLNITPLDSLRNMRCLVASSLGNPDSLNATLGDIKWHGESVHFPDHYRYTSSDIRYLEKRMKARGLTALLTTEKDAVKLKPYRVPFPVLVLEMTMTPSPSLDQEIEKIISRFI